MRNFLPWQTPSIESKRDNPTREEENGRGLS